jgi:hypothetical protein
MVLQRQINERAEPIPFYGELGSVNLQFILEDKLVTKQQNLQSAGCIINNGARTILHQSRELGLCDE